jgi:Lrp/AsnC family transcriptional regulator, leucine-responsive regulatory protein
MTAADGRAFVDEVDRAIVRALASDGRMSYTDLGRMTGLSTSAVHHRVRRLEQRGVLRGYRAVVDATSLGLPLTAFISLTPLDQSAPDDVPQRLRDLDEVEAIHAVAGEANYMIKVRVDAPSTLEDLLTTIRQKAGVSTRTTVVLSTPYEDRPPRI